MAKEWVKDARNDVKNDVHLCLETEKALGAIKEENKELFSKQLPRRGRGEALRQD